MESYSPKWTGYWYWSGNYIRSWIVRSSYAPLSCAWKWRHCLSLSSCHVHQVFFPMIHIFWIVQAMTSLDVLPLLSFSCQHPPFSIIYLHECLFHFLRGWYPDMWPERNHAVPVWWRSPRRTRTGSFWGIKSPKYGGKSRLSLEV